MSSRQTPGHVYGKQLRCGLCDYTLTIAHSGPHYDFGRWKYQLRKCPNCLKLGITSFLEPSLK